MKIIVSVAAAALAFAGLIGAAHATPITVDGTGTFVDTGNQSPRGGGPNLIYFTAPPSVFDQQMTVGVPVTVTDFITITSIDFSLLTGSDSVEENFTFTQPSNGTGTISGTGDRSGPLSVMRTALIDGSTGSITWDNDPTVITFSDGAQLQITLDDTRFGAAPISDVADIGGGDGIVETADVTAHFTLLADPTAVPEPASLMLLGAGLTGLGLVRRRRRS